MSASKLEDLVGLTAAKAAIRSLFSEQSGVHAVLLYGAEGSGKSLLADLLAQAWLCKKPGLEGPCGECQPCQSFGRGTNADFQRIEPQPPSRLIRLKAIYDNGKPDPNPLPTIPLQTYFRTPPLMARHKVVVIEDVDRMIPDAANALLKTLEEPAQHGKLILTTTAVGLILPTILSRCMALACEIPVQADLERALGPVSQVELELSGGSIGSINEIRKAPEVYARLHAFAVRLPERPQREALAAVEEFRSVCEDLEASMNTSARAATAEALKLVANVLARRQPGYTAMLVEAHRRVQGNANSGPTLDALFAGMLGTRS